MTVTHDSLAETFAAILASSDQELNLGLGALLIAKDEYPDLAIDAYIAELDSIAQGVAVNLPSDASDVRKVYALNEHLFTTLAFEGNVQAYADPRNSYLNDVLDRRLGIPITLSVVYMEVARRLGLRLHGVSFPGHFLLKIQTSDGTIVIDPFFKGALLSREDLVQRLAAVFGDDPPADMVNRYLAAADTHEILARMLRNLRAIFLAEERFDRALSAADAILQLLPDSGQEFRERGHIYRELDCFGAAADDYARYLQLVPHTSDREQIRERWRELERLRSRLN